jgi:hypothetical protein
MGEKRKIKSASRATKKQVQPRPDSDADRFTRDLLIRGEAAEPQQDGSLPAGATHEIVKSENGQVSVVRRRYSAS